MTRRKTVQHTPSVVDSRDGDRAARRQARAVAGGPEMSAEEMIEDTLGQWWDDLVVRPLEALGLIWYDDEEEEEEHQQRQQHCQATEPSSGPPTYTNTAHHEAGQHYERAPAVARISTCNGPGSSEAGAGDSSVHKAATRNTLSSSGSGSSNSLCNADRSSHGTGGGGSSSTNSSSGGAPMKQSESASYLGRLLPLDSVLDLEAIEDWWSGEDQKKAR